MARPKLDPGEGYKHRLTLNLDDELLFWIARESRHHKQAHSAMVRDMLALIYQDDMESLRNKFRKSLKPTHYTVAISS